MKKSNFTALTGLLLILFAFSAFADDRNDHNFGKELPRIRPVEPDRALETFQVKAPFRIELVAAEPLVHDPVAIAFDEQARMYVVEMRGYSEQRDEKISAVRLLEDSNGDGKYDQSTVFAGQMNWPVAVACWRGGVFVADAPDIWYMKDTDGDNKADIKQKVLTGFSHHNVQAMLNTFVWGLDNRIYCTTSTGGAKIQREGSDAKPLALRTRDFAFDPLSQKFSSTSIGGQHGMSFDNWGDKFVCTNSNHILQIMYDDKYIARNPYLKAPNSRILIAEDGSQPDVYRISPLEPWRILRTKLRLEGALMQFRLEGGGRAAGYFTAASGVTVYRGDNWPATTNDTAIVGDVGSNLIHRMQLAPNGLEFLAKRMDEKSEFIASKDSWFRPVQFANGPDGCLYVADMYREIIEHPNSFGDVIKKHLHLTSGRDRGRIYRISVDPKLAHNRNASKNRTTNLSGMNTSQLVQLLEHSNAWHRETASRLLYEKQDSSATALLRKLLKKTESPLGKVHALYSLKGLNSLSVGDLLTGLADLHPRVRQHSIRLSEQYANRSGKLDRKLLAMSDDESLHVRYQLAFSLGELTTPEKYAALSRILRKDAGNKWIRAAVLSSLKEGADVVFVELVADDAFCRDPHAREVLSELARLVARINRETQVKTVIDAIACLSDEQQPIAVAIVRGIAQGIGRRYNVIEKIIDSKSPTAGTKRFRQILLHASKIARDENASVTERSDAVELLALSPAAQVRSSLIELLDSSQPPEVGLAALAVLGRSSDLDIAKIIVDHWPSLGPKMRLSAMELLVARPDYTPLLLDSIEKGILNAGDLTGRQIQRVCLHKDEQIRQRAIRLLSPARPGKRADVVAAYRSVLKMKGNAHRGHDIFHKTCIVCHKAEGQGHELGPNLATFKSKGAEAILAAVLDPNREVNPLYVTYIAVTEDGQVLSGMLTAETATSITLTREEGKSETVLRSEIEEFRSTGQSLMPVGLEKDIDKQAMADLIAYIMTLKS